MNEPKNIDDFYWNIHYLVTSDILNSKYFYDSDRLVQKAFGAISVNRISYSQAKDHEPAFHVTIKLGELPGQQCELHKNVGEFIQLYCGISGLAYVFNPGAQTDFRGTVSQVQLNAMSDEIYKKFREVFGAGWQEIDYFDRQRGEKIVVLGVTSQPGPAQQPKPNGFGKDVFVNDVIYRVRVGSVVNGNWNGITISAKKNRQSTRGDEISN